MSAPKLCTILEAGTGGTRRHVMDVVLGLKEEFEHSVIASTLRDPFFESDLLKLEKEGVQVHRLQMTREIDPYQDCKAYREIKKILKEQSFDIVHTHSSKAGVLGRLAAHKIKVPKRIHTPHVFPFLMKVSPFKQRLYHWIEKKMKSMTTDLIAVSDEEFKAAQTLDFDEDQIHKIVNGVNGGQITESSYSRSEARQYLNLPDDDFVVGYIGRAAYQKGFDLLLESIPFLDGAFRKTIFAFIGVEASQLNHHPNYRLRGIPAQSSGSPWMKAFDLLVFPSRWEGCPYTLLEAMSLEVPVLVSNILGHLEIVGQEEAFLFESENSRELAKVLSQAIENQEDSVRKAKRGALRVSDRFSVEGMLKQIKSLYLK